MASGETSSRRETHTSDQSRRDESMGQLFKELSQDLSMLMRQELRLAQAEMTEKGKEAGLGIGMFGGAGVVLFLALQALTACFIALLSTTMKVWIAALIVSAAYAAVGGALALIAKQRVSNATPAVPEQTTQTLKEDLQWAKTQLQSGRK